MQCSHSHYAVRSLIPSDSFTILLPLHLFIHVPGGRVEIVSLLCLLECSSPPPLETVCASRGASGYVEFQCYTSNNLESETCSIDWGEAQSCNFPLRLTADDLGGGEHTLFVRWTDTCGQTAQKTEYFSLTYHQEILGENGHCVLQIWLMY